MFQLFGRESLSIYVMKFYLCKFSNLKLQGIDINPLILFLVTFVVAIGICFICSYVSLALKRIDILACFSLEKDFLNRHFNMHKNSYSNNEIIICHKQQIVRIQAIFMERWR